MLDMGTLLARQWTERKGRKAEGNIRLIAGHAEMIPGRMSLPIDRTIAKGTIL